MSEIEQYRKHIASLRLGSLVSELLDLRMTPEPEDIKAKITLIQKINEVVLQLNTREVVENGKPSEPRRTKVRSLKNLL